LLLTGKLTEEKMKIKVILSEPYNGMTSGLPTRYIGMIRQLYARHTLHIFAPGNTELLTAEFPNGVICRSSAEQPTKKKFTTLNFFRSLLFPEKNEIFLPMCDYYPEFSEIVNKDYDKYDHIYYFSLSAYLFYHFNPHHIEETCDLCDSLLRHFIANFRNSKQIKRKIVALADMLYLARIKKKYICKKVTLTVTTEKDAVYIMRSIRDNRVFAVPNGIIIPEIKFDDEYLSKKWNSKEILFCGSLNYSPNVDTITYILQTLWAQLKKRLPDVVLNIVGRDPNETLLQMINGFKDVHVYRNVPDVFTYYSSAKIILSPLFSGGGIKNKILEALCTATPIVTNREGATGIALTSGDHGLIRETENELVEAVVQLMTANSLEYSQIAMNCLELSKKYTWDEIGKQLEDVISGK
jgi:glycosyltransferase involved in cell wall biosynthesis